MSRVYGKFKIPCDGLQRGSAPEEDDIGNENTVAQRRRLYCKRYENCLTYAASLNWAGFHCGACNVNDLIPLTQRRR